MFVAQRQAQLVSLPQLPSQRAVAWQLAWPRGALPHADWSTHDAALLQSFTRRAHATTLAFEAHMLEQFASEFMPQRAKRRQPSLHASRSLR
jgi:hypothetical protein